MLVFAPVRDEDLVALDRALQVKAPANCSPDRRKEFDEKRGKVLPAFKTRFNGPFDYLATIEEYRQLFSRNEPWLPSLGVLAKAGAEGTQAIQRGLRARELYLENIQQGDCDSRDLADENTLGSLIYTIDGGSNVASDDAKKAAALVDSMLSDRASSVPVGDVKASIKAIISARFGGESPEAAAASKEFLQDLAAEYELEARRLS